MRYNFACFIIWPHGLQYFQSIIEIIAENFNIIYIKKKKFANFKKLIKNIYNFDYAPFIHLEFKTRYLKSIGCEVACVLVVNNNYQLDFFGDGKFRHSEFLNVQKIKLKIRGLYNPYNNGLITHNHVVHATDNEKQALDIMRIFKISIDSYNNKFNIPHHINFNNKVIEIKFININYLHCRIFIFKKGVRITISKEIDGSPQYKSLRNNNFNIYKSYLKKFLGYGLNDYYSVKKYMNLYKSFDNRAYDPIVINEKLSILDGLHRASILKAKGALKVKVIMIYDS